MTPWTNSNINQLKPYWHPKPSREQKNWLFIVKSPSAIFEKSIKPKPVRLRRNHCWQFICLRKNLVSDLIFNTVKVVSHLVSESFKKIPIYSLVKVVKSRKNIRFWFCIKNSVFFNFKTFSVSRKMRGYFSAKLKNQIF